MKNDKKILNISLTPETVFTTDLLYLRVSLSFALVKSVKFETANIRKAIHDFSVQSDLIKKALERIIQAALRTHKLVRFSHLVFPGLYTDARIHELNPRTITGIDLLMKVNLAGLLVIKTFSVPVNPEKVDFLLKLSKMTHIRVLEIQRIFTGVEGQVLEGILRFLQIAECFYRCLTLYLILRTNLYEASNLAKRTKDFKVGYVENAEIAKEITRLMNGLVGLKWPGQDQFNIDENVRFCIAFFDNFGKGFFAEFFN